MVNILRYFVPFVLLIYLIYHARKKIVGIVALFIFPAFGANAYLGFNDPGLPIKEIDLFFMCLLAMWAVVRWLRPRVVKFKFNLSFNLAVLIVVMLAIEFLIALYNGLPPNIFPLFYRMMVYFGVGFFLWADIFSRLKKDEVWELFYILIIPTVFLSIPYIFSALGFSIYPTRPFSSTYLNGQIIVRDFRTAPKFLALALTVILLRTNINLRWAVAFLVLLAALFFLYTRIYVIQFILAALLSVVWHLLRTKQSWILSVKYAVLFSVILIGLTFFSAFESNQFSYFSERFEEFFNYGINARNATIRMEVNKLAYNSIKSQGVIFWGHGVKRYTDIDLGAMGVPLQDSGFAFTLFFSGIIGCILYYFQMVTAVIVSFRMALSKYKAKARLGAYLFITMATWLIAILNLSYIYDGALGVIPLALVYVESLRQRD